MNLWHLVVNVGSLIRMALQENVGLIIRAIHMQSPKTMITQITFNHLIQQTAASMINITCQNTQLNNEMKK